MGEFLQGFKQGVKEAPRGFFAPLIALWRVLFRITDEEVNHHRDRKPHVV